MYFLNQVWYDFKVLCICRKNNITGGWGVVNNCQLERCKVHFGRFELIMRSAALSSWLLVSGVRLIKEVSQLDSILCFVFFTGRKHQPAASAEEEQRGNASEHASISMSCVIGSQWLLDLAA